MSGCVGIRAGLEERTCSVFMPHPCSQHKGRDAILLIGRVWIFARLKMPPDGGHVAVTCSRQKGSALRLASSLMLRLAFLLLPGGAAAHKSRE